MISKENVYYRKLTDVTVKEEAGAKDDAAKAGAKSSTEDDDDDAVKIFDPKLEDDVLAKGKLFLFCYSTKIKPLLSFMKYLMLSFTLKEINHC